MKKVVIFLISLNLMDCWLSKDDCVMDCGNYTFENSSRIFVCSVKPTKRFPHFYLNTECDQEEMKIYYTDFKTNFDKYFLSDSECSSVCSDYLSPKKAAEILAREIGERLFASIPFGENDANMTKLQCLFDESLKYNLIDTTQSEVLGACSYRTDSECKGKWKLWKKGFCSCALKFQLNYNPSQIIKIFKGPLAKKCL